MLPPVIFLVKANDVRAILDRSRHDTAIALMAWEVMSLTDLLAVTLEHVYELLPFSMGSRTVSDFTVEGATRLVQDVMKFF